MKFRIAFLAAASALLASGAMAETYECSFPRAAPISSNHILPNQVTATINGSTATVMDPVIQIVAGQPIEARVTSNTDRRITIKWELRADKRVFYALSIYPAKGNSAKIELNNPKTEEYRENRYGNEFQGASGQCARRG
ncbi:hypothetical protein [Shimia biformata]|uniref:hypothetical protein n=1 Tax=Shimia biformata TaxID=1294299 RepID=UPI0019507154|nr:hypothetical protein [Shimia biformata]